VAGRCRASIRTECISSASAKGSPERDISPSMAVANAFTLALATSARGADASMPGSMNRAWARVLGSNKASRSPVAGSNTALPALTIAVFGVVGTMICGNLGACNRGLFRPPWSSVMVHRSRTSRSSASRMLAARAVTMDEPPPRATAASAARRRSSWAANLTESTGLWATTPVNTPAQRSPMPASTASSKGPSAHGPQKTTARRLPRRTSSLPRDCRHSGP